MTRKGIAYRPQTLEPLTFDDESGLLPTMRAHEVGDYQYSRGDKTKPTLTLTGTVKALWPTPTVADTFGTTATHPKRNHNFETLHAVTLAQTVHHQELWPTPQAHDAMGGRGKQNLFADGHYYPHDLTDAVRWATPAHRDYRSPGKKTNRRPASQPLTVQAGGSLNPTWVEWLMGYPAEWTVLRRSATPSSRNASKK
jgi:hypothetical protein